MSFPILHRAELVKTVRVLCVEYLTRDFFDTWREYATSSRVDTALRRVQVAVVKCDKRLWVSWHALIVPTRPDCLSTFSR